MNLPKTTHSRFRFSLLFLALIGLTFMTAWSQTRSESEADTLFARHKLTEALDVYNAVLKKQKRNVSAAWHSSLLYSRLGHRFNSKDKKIKYFNMAKKRALKALKQEPENSMANYAMAVALGRMASISDLQAKMQASLKIRKFAVRALKADSTNDGAWDILSRWNYGFSNLDQQKRAAAEIFVGDAVKKASFENAVKYSKKAIKFNPAVVAYYYDLAMAYKMMGKNKEAIRTCKMAIKKPPVWEEGKADQKKCQNLIADLSVK